MDMEVTWEERISAAFARRPEPVNAHTYHGKFNSNASPAKLACDDGHIYVVKCGSVAAGRVAIAEQVVGVLGELLGAPTGVAALVAVPLELIAAEPELSHFSPGVAHGSRFVDGCGDRMGIDYTSVTENRARFAVLTVLYSLCFVGSDHQLIYKNEPPNLVYSVDHGHFFPSGPNWSTTTLASGPPASIDGFFGACGLTNEELARSILQLRALTDDGIALAVARPPDDWGTTMEERVALATFIAARRDALVQSYAPVSQGS